jgi:hypothetical protein
MKVTKEKVIGGAVLAGVGYLIFRKVRSNQQTAAALKAINKGGNKALGINIPDIAKQLGIELGTAFPKYNPKSWTENDTAAKILVLKVPKPYIKELIKSYKVQYPGAEPLETTLRKKLDDWEEVKYLFVA